MKRGLLSPHFPMLVCGLLAALVPFFAQELDPYLLDVAIGIGINVILAVSLNLINGCTGQFSLGHAGFMALGAYLSSAFTLFLVPHFFGEPSASSLAWHFAFLLALLVGGLGACLAGYLVGTPSLRLHGDYLALVTLGFGEIIRVLLQNCEPLGGALGLIGMPALTNLPWTLVIVGLTIYTLSCLMNSSFGLRFNAVRDDEIAARACGIDTTRFKVLAFVLGAFFAGLAGGLFAHFKLAIDPRGFDFARSIEIVVMVILGGIGRTGAVVGAAVLLTVLPEILRPVAEYRMALYAFLLILLMILRPQGLFAPRSVSSQGNP